MPTIQQGCPVIDISEWSTQLKRSTEDSSNLLEEAWADSHRKAHRVPAQRTSARKGDVTQWAEIVRGQYETGKRVVRVMRWVNRQRHGRHEFETALEEFYREVAKWKMETMHWSSISKMVSHHSYLRIIGLGREFKKGEIERLILEELESEPDHWFDALEAITGQNPVRPDDDFDAAVDAWLDWGRQEGIIADNHAERIER
jgi:hypothetical protein